MSSAPFDPGFLLRLQTPPQKVVIVRASRIGDFLVATPALRALRAALPHAELSLIGLPFVRDLVLRSPYLDRFIEFPGFPGMAEQLFDARRALSFFRRLQAEQYDLAIQLHGSGTYANPFTLMLGARYTVGSVRDSRWPASLDAAFPLPAGGHEVDRWLALAAFLGAPEQGRAVEFPLWDSDRKKADYVLAGVTRPLIGVHAGARDESKRWPVERFARVAHLLHEQQGGTVVVIGGPDEQGLGAEIARQVGLSTLDLTGLLSLAETGAVIEQLAILLTNDSGPAHIAYAFGTPSVTIFGNTDPMQWGPPPLPRHQIAIPPRPPRAEPEESSDHSRISQILVSQVLILAEAAMAGAR